MTLITKMPSILLPHVIAEQERIEREIEAKRRAEEDTIENHVIDWFLEQHKNDEEFAGHERRHYTCMTYWEFYHYIVDEVLNLPEGMRKYFKIDDYILTQWKKWKESGDKPLYIVCDEYSTGCSDDYVLLEDCEKFVPIWKGKLDKFFLDHPAKLEHFFILRYTG